MSREGSGSLSKQPVGYTPWCSTDSVVGVTINCLTVSALFALTEPGLQERGRRHGDKGG